MDLDPPSSAVGALSMQSKFVHLDTESRSSIRGSDDTGNSTKGSVHDSESFLLRLPDELLAEIVLHACRFNSAISLVFVCRTFNRIAMPVLYRTLDFDGSLCLVPPSTPAKQLLRTLEENRSLGAFCKDLNISIAEVDSGGNYAIASQLLKWFPNVQSFQIQGGFDRGNSHDTWQLISKAMVHMPRITYVRICREGDDGLLVMSILKRLNLPLLETLDIDGISYINSIRSGLTSNVVDRLLQDGGHANFTTLRLSDFGASPVALGNLIAWAKSLEHFSLGRIYTNSFSHWDWSVIGSELALHSSTLKTLAIGRLPSISIQHHLDLSSFTSLIELSLCSPSLDCSPQQSTATLLAPNLKHFTWDLDVRGPASWTAFGKAQQDWLLRFCRLAAAKISAFERVNIVLRADRHMIPESLVGYQVEGYAWDRMDAVATAVMSQGIKVRYEPNPSMSRLELETNIAQHEEQLRSSDELLTS